MKPIHFKDGVWAGVIAGVIFMVLEMIMVPLFLDGSIWTFPRRIAAILLGQDVLTPPDFFTLGIFLVATLMHFAFSVIFGLAVAQIINLFKIPLMVSIGLGATLGFLLYLLNFYGMTAFFPWFAESRNWVSAFTHISFGIATTWAYLGLLKKHNVKTHRIYQK